MKIICRDEKNPRVYVQKRDILYLESTSRTRFLLADASISKGMCAENMKMDEFVLFYGEDAIQYFLEQKDILDFQEYLGLSRETLFSRVEKSQGHPYFEQVYQELFLEKEGIHALPYPIFQEEKTLQKTFQGKNATYLFYESAIPHLFFFEIKDEQNSIYTHQLPCSFKVNCEQWLLENNLKKEFISGYNRIDNLFFLFTTSMLEKEKGPRKGAYHK